MQTRILITNITANNDGFGVDPATGEGVYIPPGVTLAADLTVGEHRMAHLVPNGAGRRVPHLAAFIPPIQLELPLEAESVRSGFEAEAEAEAEAEEGEPSTEGQIMDILGDTETYYTTGEVAEHLGMSASGVRYHLDKLFTLGEVARADIFYKSRNRAKTVLWATGPDKFL
jgi:DNA-binding transcriptional ArsR family regulator